MTQNKHSSEALEFQRLSGSGKAFMLAVTPATVAGVSALFGADPLSIHDKIMPWTSSILLAGMFIKHLEMNSGSNMSLTTTLSNIAGGTIGGVCAGHVSTPIGGFIGAVVGGVSGDIETGIAIGSVLGATTPIVGAVVAEADNICHNFSGFTEPAYEEVVNEKRRYVRQALVAGVTAVTAFAVAATNGAFIEFPKKQPHGHGAKVSLNATPEAPVVKGIPALARS